MKRWLVYGSVLGITAGYWLAQRLQPKPVPLAVESRVVLITGASSGIGRAYAHAFARRGVKRAIGIHSDFFRRRKYNIILMLIN